MNIAPLIHCMRETVQCALKNRIYKSCKRMVSRIVLLFLSFFMLVAATPGIMAAEKPAQDDEWRFHAEMYVWAPDINVTTASGTDIEITFSDIMDNLDMTLMTAFGVSKGKWSFIMDVVYLDLEFDDMGIKKAVPVGPGGRSSVKVDVDADVDMTTWQVTPSVGYTVIQNEKVRLDVLGGARYLYMKVGTKLEGTREVDIQLSRGGFVATRQVETRVSDRVHVWDAIVGVRGRVNLNEKWYLPYYGDVGAGDSDLTWQVFGGAGYRFSKLDVVAGYRYLDYEFDDDAKLDELDVGGPFLGFKFVF